MIVRHACEIAEEGQKGESFVAFSSEVRSSMGHIWRRETDVYPDGPESRHHFALRRREGDRG